MKRDRYLSFLNKKRTDTIHVKYVDIKRVEKITITASIGLSYKITIIDSNGKIVSEYEGPKPNLKNEPPKTENIAYFEDLEDKSLLDVCEYCMSEIKNILNEWLSRISHIKTRACK